MLGERHMMEAVQELIQKRGYIDIPSNGFSMYPLIPAGSLCRFEPFRMERLKVGDIVLFVAEHGVLVGHRYIGDGMMDGRIVLRCKGDSNVSEDPPVRLDQVVGIMVFIRKSGVTYRMHSRHAALWRWIALTYPSAALVIQAYLRISGKLKRRKLRTWTA